MSPMRRYPSLEPIKTAAITALASFAPHQVRRLSPFHMREDRALLETAVFPSLLEDPEVRRVLFVGCDWYTKHYEGVFRSIEYWTIEPDEQKARFGGERHIVGPLHEICDHVQNGYFDAIICNGVFYRGAMDDPVIAEQSFERCWRVLRPGGWFVLGWNDTPELLPYPTCESTALARFERAALGELGEEWRTETDNNHTYSFFRRPERNAVGGAHAKDRLE